MNTGVRNFVVEPLLHHRAMPHRADAVVAIHVGAGDAVDACTGYYKVEGVTRNAGAKEHAACGYTTAARCNERRIIELRFY